MDAASNSSDSIAVTITRRLATLPGDVVAALAWDPAVVLGATESAEGSDDDRHLIPLQARIAGVSFDRFAAVGFGPLVEEDDGARVMPVWWEAAEQPWLFPTFDGGLEVRQVGDETELRLEGRYRPPLGAAGHLVNRAVLNRAATRSLEALLDRLADRLRELPAATG